MTSVNKNCKLYSTRSAALHNGIECRTCASSRKNDIVNDNDVPVPYVKVYLGFFRMVTHLNVVSVRSYVENSEGHRSIFKLGYFIRYAPADVDTARKNAYHTEVGGTAVMLDNFIRDTGDSSLHSLTVHNNALRFHTTHLRTQKSACPYIRRALLQSYNYSYIRILATRLVNLTGSS